MDRLQWLKWLPLTVFVIGVCVSGWKIYTSADHAAIFYSCYLFVYCLIGLYVLPTIHFTYKEVKA